MNTKWSAAVGKDIESKTSEEAIALAGLNWKVAQAPVLFRAGDEVHEVKNQRVNYREDTQHVLGVVSDSYKVLQNRDAFRFLDSLIGVAEAMYVNVGSFKSGAKVYIQAELPGSIKFDDGGYDLGKKLLTFVTSHDGSLPVSVMFTPIRIVCQNTLLMALRHNERKTSVRHTLNMVMGLREAKETLGIINEQFSILERISRKLIETPFKREHIPQLLSKAGMIPKEADLSTRAQNIIEDVSRLFDRGAGADLPSAKGTAWGGYNAVVEYIDHARVSNAEKRAESSMLGSGALIKERALELLTAI